MTTHADQNQQRTEAAQPVTLRDRIAARRTFPQTLGLSCTAIGDRGGWRQGYERAIDDVLQILDTDEL